MKNITKFGIGFGIGLLLGVGIALLTAPQTGKETRRLIAEKAKAIKGKLRKHEIQT